MESWTTADGDELRFEDMNVRVDEEAPDRLRITIGGRHVVVRAELETATR